MANPKYVPVWLSLVAIFAFFIIFYFVNDYTNLDYQLLGVFPTRMNTSNLKYCYKENASTIIIMQLSNGSDEWLPLEMCAIRTAAIWHQQTGVCVLTRSDMKLHPKLTPLTNIEITRLDINFIFHDTPLEEWYNGYASNSTLASKTVMWELSDALRYAYVFKYGGKYLDSDMLTLRNFSSLQNVVAWQGDGYINGAMLFFEPKHPFVKVALDSFMKYFSPGGWGSVGPGLITRVHKSGLVDNTTYTVLERDSFYPVHYVHYEMPFQAEKIEEIKSLTRRSYGLHLWRYMFKGHKIFSPWANNSTPPIGSYIEEFMDKFC